MAVIDHWAPFVYNITPLESDSSRYTALGLNMDVLRELENMMNFTTHLIKGNGSWTAMTNLVSTQAMDFSAAAFSHVHTKYFFHEF